MREPGGHDELATQLVAWDVVRRRAQASLLTIPLPRIALREAPTSDAGAGVALHTVAVPRLWPRFAPVMMAWPTICDRRGALHDDVFGYAMAWCRHARQGDRDLERVLVGLVASTVPGLRAAALDDLVNVVADAHDAASAMRILARVSPPPGTLEKLAAIYTGLGREDDADVVRTHLPPPPPAPPPQTGCAELTLALETFVPQSLPKIRSVAAGSSSCAPLARSIVCRIAVSAATPLDPMCGRAGTTAPRDDREAHYLAAYARWGTDWFAVVDHAVKAMPEPGAEQVAISALAASLRSGCEPDRLDGVRARANLLLREPAHDARWTPTLRSLAGITPKACAGLPVSARTSP